jgi:uncharacterized protein YukE
MSVVGADIPALRAFVSALSGRARKIEQTKNELSAVIRDLPWVGKDRDAFIHDWEQIHHPNLVRLIDDMQDASAKANHHANVQENASRA